MADAIIFDIDGTLLDSVDYHARAWQETFARYGIEVSFEAVRGQIGKGGDQLMPVFVPKDLLDRVEDELTEARGRHFKEKYLPLVRPFPMVRDLFLRLKDDGKRIVLASSASRDEVEEYKTIANIADLIESATSSDDADRSKPHPDIFLAAMVKLGNPDRSTVVVVGDTPNDAEAAGKAGLKTVGVLCGGFPADDLTRAGCIGCTPAPPTCSRSTNIPLWRNGIGYGAYRLPLPPRTVTPGRADQVLEARRGGRVRGRDVFRPHPPVAPGEGAGRVRVVRTRGGPEGTNPSFGTVCAPGDRYHPAVIAQASALSVMYPVGCGSRSVAARR